MPWQQLVADVGLELNDQGRLAYREIIVTVPRQSGKTTLVLAFELQRALGWHGAQTIAYTAQTGWDARKKLLNDQVPMIEQSPLKQAIAKVMRGVGQEAVWFTTGSRVEVMATSAAAGHGRTIDFAVIDEAFSDTDGRREQALLPAMATKKDGQLLIVSTAGTDESLYLRHKVEIGRQHALSDASSGIAYFEWSAPDDADWEDPTVWASCMPALGHTIDLGVVEHAKATMSEGEFRRAFLNQWTVATDRLIPSDAWVRASGVEDCDVEVFGFDASPDRSTASIVAAGHGIVAHVDTRHGVGWLAERCKELHDRYRVPFAVDPLGPAGSIVGDLERHGVTVRQVGGRDFISACSTFYDAIMDGNVTIRRHQLFDDAAAGVVRRPAGDQFVWGRKTSMVDISPLVAATVAWFAVQQPGVEKTQPIFAY